MKTNSPSLYCRLWREDLGIHLIKGNPLPRSPIIDPQSDHISFQASCPLDDIAERLRSMSISFMRDTVREGHFIVEQLFFHDPDNFMIEICNCECLPTVLIASGGGNLSAHSYPLCKIDMQNNAAHNFGIAPALKAVDSTCSDASVEYLHHSCMIDG